MGVVVGLACACRALVAVMPPVHQDFIPNTCANNAWYCFALFPLPSCPP
jgi:hypothetical protein